MNYEHEPVISASTIKWRKRLAEHPISNALFPIEYRDPLNTLSGVDLHLKSGGSVLMVITHPSIEDIMRVGKLLVKSEVIRERRIGGPAAVHQKVFVDLATAPFDFESAYVPTRHTRNKRKVSGGEDMGALIRFKNLVIGLLENNSVLVIESQADQKSSLSRPTIKPVELIMRIIKAKHIPNVHVVPIGIEIEGIHGDYEHARNITLARHRYLFNVGRAFTAEKIIALMDENNIAPDDFIYIQHRTLVSPEYLSK